jgi:hypothetical protein
MDNRSRLRGRDLCIFGNSSVLEIFSGEQAYSIEVALVALTCRSVEVVEVTINYQFDALFLYI